jgi:hypothetical protein
MSHVEKPAEVIDEESSSADDKDVVNSQHDTRRSSLP